MPVVDFAPTRIFREARQVRTPVWSPAVIAIDPDASEDSLAHPRLVRRMRSDPPASGSSLRLVGPPNRDFDDDEPTKKQPL